MIKTRVLGKAIKQSLGTARNEFGVREYPEDDPSVASLRFRVGAEHFTTRMAKLQYPPAARYNVASGKLPGSNTP